MVKKPCNILFLCITVFVFLSSVTLQAYANESNAIKIIINESIVVFEPGEQSPILENNRVLVPMRKLFETLDCDVTYHGPSGTITVTNEDGIHIVLTIGARQAYVSGRLVEIDIAPKVVHGSTLVPLRFVSESINAMVNWDNATNTVEVKTFTGERNPDFIIDAPRKTIVVYRGTEYGLIIPSQVNGFPIDTIGYQSFGNNLIAHRIRIAEGIKTIEPYAFWRTVNLTEIHFPDSLETIGEANFWGCDQLTEIHIGKNVSAMEMSFVYCKGLLNINIDQENQNYSSIDGVVFSKDRTAIVLYPGGKEATSFSIPDGVEMIERECFFGHSYLSHIDMPDTVRSIGWNAFGVCKNITNIVLPASAKELADLAFYYCDNLETIIIPESVTYIGENAFEGCEKLTIYGLLGSYAEEYAKANNIPFSVIV